MSNRNYFVFLLLMITSASVLAGCGSKEDDQLVVSPTPEAVVVLPTEVPALQSTSFTSTDGSISIELPDTTWVNKIDQTDMLSFESTEQGKILIMHETDEQDLASTLIPTTQDLAKAMAQSGGLTEGADFLITDFTADTVANMNRYYYIVEYKDATKSNGVYASIYEYFVGEQEVYSVEGTVKSADTNVYSGIQTSIASMQLNAVAQTTAATDATPTPEAETAGSIESLSEEILSDTTKTRTIYRNSDGQAIPIMLDETGNWVDESGNVYRFSETEASTVYDAQDNDYYYGGEAANVFYMTTGNDNASDSGDNSAYDYDSDYYDDYYYDDYDNDYYYDYDDYYDNDYDY